MNDPGEADERMLPLSTPRSQDETFAPRRDYVTNATPVVVEQIKRAGVSLGTVLNEALK
jgi:hypothetical protein